MKNWEKRTKRLFMYILSFVMLCGTITFSAPVKADSGVKPDVYSHELNSGDSYVALWSQQSTSASGTNKLTVNIYVNSTGSTIESPLIYKFSSSSSGNTLDAYVIPKTGYVLSSMTYKSKNVSAPTPVQNPMELTLNSGTNTLNIYLKTGTQVTVMQIHADGTSSTDSYGVPDSTTQNISTTLTHSSNEKYDGYAISPVNGDSTVTKDDKNNALNLSVTGDSSAAPSILLKIFYECSQLNDTLQIKKNLYQKFDANTDSNFWLQFAVNGATQNDTKPVDVAVVIDRSFSMGYKVSKSTPSNPTSNDTTWLAMLQNALNTNTTGFIDSVLNANPLNQISIVDYSGLISNYSNIKLSTVCNTIGFTSDRTTLKNHVATLAANGGTQTDAGLKTALNMFNNVNRDSKKVVVLFTDGLPGEWPSSAVGEAFSAYEQAKAIKDAGYELYTIGYIPTDSDYTDPTERVCFSNHNFNGNTPINTSTYDNVVTTPTSYPYTIKKDGSSNYWVTLGAPYSGPSYPIQDGGTNWLVGPHTFSASFLQTLATSADDYYDGTTTPVNDIFSKICTKISSIAANATITDEIQPDNCHLLTGNDTVEWRHTNDTGWTTMGTAATGDPYYTVITQPVNGTGGKIAFHFNAIDSGGIIVKFKVAPNNGVCSSATASENKPDLPTNQTANISYTDVNNTSEFKTSEQGDNYNSGLDTPHIYLPNCTLNITKNINQLYYDSPLLNKVSSNQSFIFKIQRTADSLGSAKTFYEVISFPSDTTLSSEITKTITGLAKGTYTVTEETGWSWKYSQTAPASNASFTVTLGNKVAGNFVTDQTATFINQRKSTGWLGDVAAAINTVTK
jgi:hypothetical protein